MSDSMQQSQYRPAPPTNTMAIISLVAAIAGWTVAPIIGGIVAVITGHMARNEIMNSHGAQGGEGLAVAGLVLGYLNLVIMCLTVLIPIVIFGAPLLGCGICGICGALTDPNSYSSFHQTIPFIPSS